MEAMNWTRPEAYGLDETVLAAAVIRSEASRAYRMLDQVSSLLDRAALASRSPAVRSAIGGALGHLADWTETHEVLRRTLVSDHPISIPDMLGEVCRAMGRSARRPDMPVPEVSLEASSTTAAPATAWVLAAAAVEMIEEGQGRSPASIRLHMIEDRLLVLVSWPRRPREARSRRLERTEPFRRSRLLDDLGGLLKARVVRLGRGAGRGVGLVVDTVEGAPGAPA